MKDSEFPQVELISNETQTFPDQGCTRCPICGKVFYVRLNTTWTYKLINKHDKQRFMCGWNCFVKAEKLQATSKQQKQPWRNLI